MLDEADKMLDYDYEADLLAILELIPRQRQTALYSATMTTRVRTGEGGKGEGVCVALCVQG